LTAYLIDFFAGIDALFAVITDENRFIFRSIWAIRRARIVPA
jgi:hypothetical protein